MQPTDLATSADIPKYTSPDPKYLPAPIDRILEIALLKTDVDLDKLERLYLLKRQYENDQARNAFTAAMAAFKAEPITIDKDRHVNFTTSKGTTDYWSATIGNVVAKLVPALAAHGFSHRWDSKQDGGKIAVTCILTHQQGHSETYTLVASPDDSGGKNAIQSIASTQTYLQRYSLLGVTGYATVDQFDDDGQSSEKTPEEIEKANAQETMMKQWEAAFLGAATPAELADLKRECAKACGGADMMPQRLTGAYAQRLRAIQDKLVASKEPLVK